MLGAPVFIMAQEACDVEIRFSVSSEDIELWTRLWLLDEFGSYLNA